MVESKRILIDENLDSESALEFKKSLIKLGYKIADASGGLFGFGSRVCKQEKAMLKAIASILAMEHGIIPPTINHETIDPNINSELNLTLNKAQKRNIKVAMSNTFGFGGHNACVLFKKID